MWGPSRLKCLSAGATAAPGWVPFAQSLQPSALVALLQACRELHQLCHIASLRNTGQCRVLLQEKLLPMKCGCCAIPRCVNQAETHRSCRRFSAYSTVCT